MSLVSLFKNEFGRYGQSNYNEIKYAPALKYSDIKPTEYENKKIEFFISPEKFINKKTNTNALEVAKKANTDDLGSLAYKSTAEISEVNNLEKAIDKSDSLCQLYVDSSLCAGIGCQYKILRFQEITNTNPFSNDVNPYITIDTSGLIVSEADLYDIYIGNSLNSISDDNERLELFLEKLSFFISSYCESTYYINKNNIYPTYVNTGYIAISTRYTISIASAFPVLSVASESFTYLCLHIAGCSGACSGAKLDTEVPPSNVYISENKIKLYSNCNPFNCYRLNSSEYDSACMRCPQGAIKHKDTETSAVPDIDYDSPLQQLTRKLFNEKPFAI